MHVKDFNLKNIDWYYSLNIAGVVTEGLLSEEYLQGCLDKVFTFDIVGKTILDINTKDGFFSFESERRGAKRVLATDWFGWKPKIGFNTAKMLLGSSIEEDILDIMDISVDTVGYFDVVFLMFSDIKYLYLEKLLSISLYVFIMTVPNKKREYIDYLLCRFGYKGKFLIIDLGNDNSLVHINVRR